MRTMNIRPAAITALTLSFAIIAVGTSAQDKNTKQLPTARPMATATAAPDKPDVTYITQTTSKIDVPEGGSEDDMWALMQEYYDKVISKSAIVKHYMVYRHAWGSMGASLVLTLEFKTWEDIMKFNQEEREALEKAAWPDEMARKAFFKKMDAYEDPHHHDEIYVVRNSMRR